MNNIVVHWATPTIADTHHGNYDLGTARVFQQSANINNVTILIYLNIELSCNSSLEIFQQSLAVFLRREQNVIDDAISR